MDYRTLMDQEVVKHIEKLMKKGVLMHESGREFYTGYAYETLYDWDQYFEAIVQLYMGWPTDYIENGVIIFLDNQQEDGLIPRSIPVPDVFEGQGTEHCKPFLAQILWMLMKENVELTWFDDMYYQKLMKFVQYWLVDKDPNGNHLSTWDSAPHTGMDNQHERAGWWFDKFCEGVDLSSFLYRECIAMSKISQHRGDLNNVSLFESYAAKIKTAVNDHMWNEEEGFYYDLDERTGEQIKVKHIGAFATMWAGIASKEQAKRLVEEHLTNTDEFWRSFPVPALAATEPGYSEQHLPGDLGCSWRAQTWIPTNYYVMRSLIQYGYDELAKQLADITYRKISEIGDREYYNTESSTGNGLDPFWGWSLLGWFMPAEVKEDSSISEL